MLRNIISSFFTRAFIAAINLAILLIIAKHLGSSIVGQISVLILNIAIIQSIVEIYTGSTLVYFIPKGNGLKIYQYGLFWLLITTVLTNVFFYYANIGNSNLSIHVFILSVLMSLNAFHCVYLLGKEQIKKYNFIILLQPLLLLLCLCYNIFIKENTSLHSYLLSMYFAVSATLLFSLAGFIVTVKRNLPSSSEFQFKQIVSNGFINQLANIAHTLSNRLNYYLLGISALVGVYASSSSLIESLWIISAGISPLLLTHIANQRNTNNQAQLTLLLAKLSFILSLFGVLFLYFLPNEFFIYLLGKDFTHTKKLMLYLSPGVLCISFSSIISHYFSGQGLQKIQLTANVSGLLVTAITAWFFIQHYGITGACLSASCSYAVQSIVLLFVFMKSNQFKLGMLFSFRNDLKLLRG